MTKKEFMALVAKCDRPAVTTARKPNMPTYFVVDLISHSYCFDTRLSWSGKTNEITIDEARGFHSADKKAAKYRRWLDNNI